MPVAQAVRFPFTPYPYGIYAVAFSHEVKNEQVLSLIFMGESIVLFRTKQGQMGAIDSYCPHLGAHLALGKVKNDQLQCPFHGLRFNPAGCAFAKDHKGQVTKYHTKSWHVFEKYGVIFLKKLNKNNSIHFPEWDMQDWGNPIFHCFKIKSHPQEILENTVDKRHFFSVHHYLNVEQIGPIKMNGPEFEVDYQLTRSQGIFGIFDKRKTDIRLNIHIYGLGLSCVNILIPHYHLEAKQIVMPTPIEGEFIYIRALTSVKIPKKLRFLASIFKKLITQFLCRLAAKGFLKDFMPDLSIWENKRYIAEPHYLANDGDFEQYRAWAQQFYLDINNLPNVMTAKVGTIIQTELGNT